MNDALRRRTDKFSREDVFIKDSSEDFPQDSPVDVISAEISGKLEQILILDAELESTLGDKRQARDIKDDSRDILVGELEDIQTAAVAIGDDEEPGITAKFKFPRPRTDQNLIAAAQARYDDSASPLEEKFVLAGLPADFRKEMRDARTDFMQNANALDLAVEQHGEAVGALDDLVRKAMELSRRRSALVKLKYKNNPGKLAAWAIASHLERPPKPAPKPTGG